MSRDFSGCALNAIKIGFRYSDALVGLVTAVLNKMQFTYNHNQLEDGCVEDEDDEVQIKRKKNIFLLLYICNLCYILE